MCDAFCAFPAAPALYGSRSVRGRETGGARSDCTERVKNSDVFGVYFSPVKPPAPRKTALFSYAEITQVGRLRTVLIEAGHNPSEEAVEEHPTPDG